MIKLDKSCTKNASRVLRRRIFDSSLSSNGHFVDSSRLDFTLRFEMSRDSQYICICIMMCSSNLLVSCVYFMRWDQHGFPHQP
ncbi:hypothetical protein EUGRSUZ_J02228 [Eucalyptus grandis]|uniref:Uncharacterized protein n=2 Tax=Eucalyptus grandis TaxID=71139 RepID=A0A059AGF7_EUCGR|nr:hypothetical protein EUGRSUZ_J02228 [Eucalyptus grandis]